MRPKRELIRVVRTAAGEIKVDVAGKLSGRGAYVCPTPQCAEAGVREGRLQHALLAPIPEDVGADLERAIETVRTAQSRSDRQRLSAFRRAHGRRERDEYVLTRGALTHARA